MNDKALYHLASLSRAGLGGDRIKAAQFSIVWPLIAPSLVPTMIQADTTKTAGLGGMIMPGVIGMMVGLPILSAYLQKGQMEAYNRGRMGVTNEMAPIIAATMGPYGGLGIPTSMRNLTGLQGQGMV